MVQPKGLGQNQSSSPSPHPSTAICIPGSAKPPPPQANFGGQPGPILARIFATPPKPAATPPNAPGAGVSPRLSYEEWAAIGRQLRQEEEPAKRPAQGTSQTPPDLNKHMSIAGEEPKLTYEEWTTIDQGWSRLRLQLEEEQAKERAKERKNQEDAQRAAAKAKPQQEYQKTAS